MNYSSNTNKSNSSNERIRGNKTLEEEVMHNTVVYPQLPNVQPVLQKQSAAPGQVALVDTCTHYVLWHGMALWPVWVSSPGCAPTLLLVHLLTGRTQGIEKFLTGSEPC